MPRRRRCLPSTLLLGLLASACATAPLARSGSSARLAILVPTDGVPIRSLDVLGVEREEDVDAARERTLEALRGDLAEDLRARGVDVVEVPEGQAVGRLPHAPELAALGRQAGADYALATELVAFGQLRRSWLWVLVAQGFAAGIGHGVLVAAATGNPTYGWWAGAAEFALETVTWVGGALVGSRVLDPVLVRSRLVDTASGEVVGHWTREGTRPFRRWFHRQGEPSRDVRLRAVADGVLAKLGKRVCRRLLGARCHDRPPPVASSAATAAPG